MKRKLMVGVIAAALLVSGGLVGVSYGQGSGISEPEVIELTLDLCGDSCRGFELRDVAFGRRGTAWIVVSEDPLFDVDGTRVGNQNEQCTVSYGRNDKGGTAWLCTYVITLKAGPHTELGTVVLTGIYHFGGETLAVTGGTGAYENVRGYATMVIVDDREVLTLNLIP